ncbi:MAG TPA: lysine--tRNA ligase [Thermomicrobiales bacterium]|nr:lysine--tRNA ligase [Thermomicrobiales bacterium]
MDLELNDLQQNRRQKAELLRQLRFDPYASRAARTHTTAEAIAHFTAFETEHEAGTADERELTVAGRLVSRRDMGKTVFAHIRDGHGQLQLYLRVNDLGDERFEQFNRLADLGDFVQATGRLFRTRTGEISLRAREITILTKALNAPPEKWKGLQDVEIRYRQRYADLIANSDVRLVFEQRARMITAIRQFLDDQGFIEVETPTLQPLYGGAAARPFTTHHNALDQTFYLRIADELYLKRLIAGGYERVYEICKDFRNEGMDRNHQPEFTMLEWYEAYADYRTVMDRAEALFIHVAQRVHGSERFSTGGHEIDLSPPWRRVTLREAIKNGSGIDYVEYPDTEELTRVARAAGAEIPTGMVWPRIVDELLKQFVRPRIAEPTILYDYPVELSPLAKRKSDDPTHAERFQIYIAGHELANAFTELNDPIDQLGRFLDQARDRAAGDEEAMPIDLDYVNALMYGMPPTGGIGIGIDRLAMFISDQSNIRDVILFPAMRKLPIGGLASLAVEGEDDVVTGGDGISEGDE